MILQLNMHNLEQGVYITESNDKEQRQIQFLALQNYRTQFNQDAHDYFNNSSKQFLKDNLDEHRPFSQQIYLLDQSQPVTYCSIDDYTRTIYQRNNIHQLIQGFRKLQSQLEFTYRSKNSIQRQIEQDQIVSNFVCSNQKFIQTNFKIVSKQNYQSQNQKQIMNTGSQNENESCQNSSFYSSKSSQYNRQQQYLQTIMSLRLEKMQLQETIKKYENIQLGKLNKYMQMKNHEQRCLQMRKVGSLLIQPQLSNKQYRQNILTKCYQIQILPIQDKKSIQRAEIKQKQQTIINNLAFQHKVQGFYRFIDLTVILWKKCFKIQLQIQMTLMRQINILYSNPELQLLFQNFIDWYTQLNINQDNRQQNVIKFFQLCKEEKNKILQGLKKTNFKINLQSILSR